MNTDTFDFSEALKLLKQGKTLSRVAFLDTCRVKMKRHEPVEYPSNIICLDYIEMHKVLKVFADNEPGSYVTTIFPLDLSCESILADDWYILEE